MIKGVTKSGFKFTIADKILDDYELLELVSNVDNNPILVPKIFEKLLGEKQKNKMVDWLKKKDGYASVEKMSELLTEILTYNQKLKN